jgi:hypothetical protein
MAAAFFGYDSIHFLRKRRKLNIVSLSFSGFLIGAIITSLALVILYISDLDSPELARLQKHNFNLLMQSFKLEVVAGISSAFGAFIFSLISGATKANNISQTSRSTGP